VLGNLSRDPLHVGGFPRKHVEVRFEEVDERAFLFRIEDRPDTEFAAIIGDDHILDVLGGLERSRPHAWMTWGHLGPWNEAQRGASQIGQLLQRTESTQRRTRMRVGT
jgi:hypothetical protein